MEQMREEFEEWAFFHHYEMRREGDGYYGNLTNLAWQAWQASRAALVVELPKEPEDPCGAMPWDRGQVDAMRVMLEDCQTALDAAGVRFK